MPDLRELDEKQINIINKLMELRKEYYDLPNNASHDTLERLSDKIHKVEKEIEGLKKDLAVLFYNHQEDKNEENNVSAGGKGLMVREAENGFEIVESEQGEK